MRNPHLSSPRSYKPAEPISTPFRKAHQLWDLRIGTPTVQAKNWRIASCASAMLNLVLGTSLAILLQQAKVIPVIVGLDKQTGEPTVVGPVDQSKYQPGPLETKFFLAQFVQNVRSVPLDPVLIRQNWLRAYSFMRKEAAGLLNEMTEKDANSPLKKIGKVLVSVQPIGVLEIPGTKSYQLRWKETVYSPQGMKLEEYTMLATFIIEIDPPKDSQTLQDNPLGIFIRSFSWNREL